VDRFVAERAADRVMVLVQHRARVHAGHSIMPRRFVMRLPDFARVCAAWTVVAVLGMASSYVRARSGELTLAPGWYWLNLGTIAVWSAVTPPILALSRRLPLERGTWRLTVLAHLGGLLAVLVIDGAACMVFSPMVGGQRLTLWQQMWRWSFLNAFFYAGVVCVEHAGRFYRLYVDRRIRASELEAQVSRAQLQALQMQIRPHFLFNTLNTISGLVRIDDRASAITMLAGLGELLRMLLRSDGAQEVPVHQELALIERYLQIEQVRFGDRLAVEVSVEPGVEDALVPNLILQPLVENAVRHGVGADAGRVTVRVRQIDRALRMEVSDSGEARPEPGDSLGIGLANTRERLERLYGAGHRFELARSAAGTRAIIELPLHRASVAS
jgi:two-component system LytT family sensor kinase